MTLQEIDEMAITVPYCFENEREEQWYKVGLREGADAAIEQLGWHPASELPKEDGEYITIMSNSLGEHGEICFNDFSNGEWRYTGYDWEPREVLLWCYPPKEDKK